MTALEYVKHCINRDFPEDLAEVLSMFVDENMEKLQQGGPAGGQADDAAQAAGQKTDPGAKDENAENTQIVDVMIPFIAFMQAYSQIMKDEEVVMEYCKVILDAAPKELADAMIPQQQ